DNGILLILILLAVLGLYPSACRGTNQLSGVFTQDLVGWFLRLARIIVPRSAAAVPGSLHRRPRDGDRNDLAGLQVAELGLVAFQFWIVPLHFFQLCRRGLSGFTLTVKDGAWMKSPDHDVVIDHDGVVLLHRGHLLSRA